MHCKNTLFSYKKTSMAYHLYLWLPLKSHHWPYKDVVWRGFKTFPHTYHPQILVLSPKQKIINSGKAEPVTIRKAGINQHLYNSTHDYSSMLSNIKKLFCYHQPQKYSNSSLYLHCSWKQGRHIEVLLNHFRKQILAKFETLWKW